MTQKDLANQLFVTAQAVSRWEKGEVEPSISAISKMAQIFNVTTDDLLGALNDTNTEPETEQPQSEGTQKIMLALCEKCNSPIFEKDDICRETERPTHSGGSAQTHLYCRACMDKIKAEREEARAKNEQWCIDYGKRWRLYGLLLGLLGAALVVVLAFCIQMPMIAFGAIPAFTLIGCLCMQNNFIADLIETVGGWSISFPGVIFTWDIEGCLFMIGMKLLFSVLGFLVSAAALVFSITLGAAVSVIAYPFALGISFTDPARSAKD